MESINEVAVEFRRGQHGDAQARPTKSPQDVQVQLNRTLKYDPSAVEHVS